MCPIRNDCIKTSHLIKINILCKSKFWKLIDSQLQKVTWAFVDCSDFSVPTFFYNFFLTHHSPLSGLSVTFCSASSPLLFQTCFQFLFVCFLALSLFLIFSSFIWFLFSFVLPLTLSCFQVFTLWAFPDALTLARKSCICLCSFGLLFESFRRTPHSLVSMFHS